MNVIQYVRLDVHNDSIALSIAPNDSAEVRRARRGSLKAVTHPILELSVKTSAASDRGRWITSRTA